MNKKMNSDIVYGVYQKVVNSIIGLILHTQIVGFFLLCFSLYIGIGLLFFNPDHPSVTYLIYNTATNSWAPRSFIHTLSALCVWYFGIWSFVVVFMMMYVSLYVLRYTKVLYPEQISGALLIMSMGGAFTHCMYWRSYPAAGKLGLLVWKLLEGSISERIAYVVSGVGLSVGFVLLSQMAGFTVIMQLCSVMYEMRNRKAAQNIRYIGQLLLHGGTVFIRNLTALIIYTCSLSWLSDLIEGSDIVVPDDIDIHELEIDYQFYVSENEESIYSMPKVEEKKVVPPFNSALNSQMPEIKDSEQLNNHLKKTSLYHQAPEHSSVQEISTFNAKKYILPHHRLFEHTHYDVPEHERKQQFEAAALTLQEKLKRFGVNGKVTNIKPGPVVTLYEYEPEIDTKVSRILSLEDDLALALQALSIRIIAPIPGTSVVGFEVANQSRLPVLFSSIIAQESLDKTSHMLPLALGVDTTGGHVLVDLVRMPHLLIAGSTGSGKSVSLHTMLLSLLCSKKPDLLKLIIIDPKRLEFTPYTDIPHLLFPIVTDPRRAAIVLRWVVNQMEQRYEQMAQLGVRNIAEYNQRVSQPLPYIVIIIDELADLMMTAGRDIEELITRIAQMARASGIHMIVATQRPSVDVITGIIKVNFPSRIAFRVTSKVDSRTILDAIGADKLLGKGDMLFLDAHAAILARVHGCYASDEEINRVADHVRSFGPPLYQSEESEVDEYSEIDESDKELYAQVVEFINQQEEISISLLQRQFRIGYNRSARIIDMLELHGKILPSQSGKRKVVK